MEAFSRRNGLEDSTPVMREEISHNTPTNAIQVGALVGEDIVDVVTVGYHTKASKTLFERHGVNVRHVIASEEVLKLRARNPEAFIGNFHKSSQVKKGKRVEFVRNLLLHVDRKGKLLTAITGRTRK